MKQIISVCNESEGTQYHAHWNWLITAGRAHEGLYAPWRQQLRQVQREMGFSYIRFHGIFNDEMMVYREDEAGNPLRANTVYCLKVDGTLSWFQDLPAPATA